jgi:excisionase family DNA binding protein
MDYDVILNRLDEIKNFTLLGAKQALTMSEAALLTGLSKSHLYKLVCAKRIPYYKAQEGGKLTYFDKNELNCWCLSRRIKTNEELELEAATYLVTGKIGGRR